MSIVTVQLGQCGNQIGSQFFSTVASDLQSSSDRRVFGDYEDECVDRFFSVDDRGKWAARAVMVDTEPKVVNAGLSVVHSLVLLSILTALSAGLFTVLFYVMVDFKCFFTAALWNRAGHYILPCGFFVLLLLLLLSFFLI